MQQAKGSFFFLFLALFCRLYEGKTEDKEERGILRWELALAQMQRHSSNAQLTPKRVQNFKLVTNLHARMSGNDLPMCVCMYVCTRMYIRTDLLRTSQSAVTEYGVVYSVLLRCSCRSCPQKICGFLITRLL